MHCKGECDINAKESDKIMKLLHLLLLMVVRSCRFWLLLFPHVLLPFCWLCPKGMRVCLHP
jgi:hypothetical protein